jgi:hypothetical protein
MKKLILFSWFCCLCAKVHAEPSWELKKDQDGIKVYSATVEGSNIKAVKVACTVNTTLSRLTALLLDTKSHEKWVYNTKVSYLVKQVSPDHLVYYSEVTMPWPLSNRDVTVDLTIRQQQDTKVMYVVANTIAGQVPVKSDKVRVPLSKVNWTVTPLANNQLSIEYVGQADPGGSVPAWLVNSFSTKGPFETFKKLRELVNAPIYANSRFDFIKD